jgi:riboflavin synthase
VFTGLIECTGTVVALRPRGGGARLTVRSGLQDLAVGESIAVNGACQTVAAREGTVFACDVLGETLRVTNIGSLSAGSTVNLERAMRSGDRFGGHIVSGHVDGLGTVRRVSGTPPMLGISVAPGLLRYLVPKGSVAVDGISLTVGPRIGRGSFDVYVVPHTVERTNLAGVRVGRKVNIEVDILAKYVERFIGGARA